MTRVAGKLLVLFLIVLTVAACGGDNDDPEPTSSAAPAPTETNGAAITGGLASDGVCQVTIPDEWIDVGTGRGTTEQGDRWSLFGGSIASDAAWTSAKELLRTQMSTVPEADITDEGDRITVTTPDGRRYIVRQRFDDRYCELSVIASQDRSEGVQAIWQGVAETLAPVERQ